MFKRFASSAIAVALCLSLVTFETACSSAQAANVVATIETQLPLALQTAGTVANLSGDPILGAIFATAGKAAQADIPGIQAAVAAWKANKSSGNLAALAAAVNALASNVNAQVLAANRLANTQNEQLALLSLTGLAALINGMSGALASVNPTKSARLILPEGFHEVMAITPREQIASVADAYGVSPEYVAGM